MRVDLGLTAGRKRRGSMVENKNKNKHDVKQYYGRRRRRLRGVIFSAAAAGPSVAVLPPLEEDLSRSTGKYYLSICVLSESDTPL